MHELGLIKKIIDNAQNAATNANVENVKILRLRIGKMAGFDPEQLTFLFETYEKSPAFKDTKLEVEEVSVELSCNECKHEYIDERFDDHEFAHMISHAPMTYSPIPCPKCASESATILTGQELDLVDLEGE